MRNSINTLIFTHVYTLSFNNNSKKKIGPEAGPVGNVSPYIRCYFAKLHEIREVPDLEKFMNKCKFFWLKLLIFGFGLFDPPEIFKVSLIVILKYSPLKTDDFRILQTEKISFQSEIWNL